MSESELSESFKTGKCQNASKPENVRIKKYFESEKCQNRNLSESFKTEKCHNWIATKHDFIGRCQNSY